MNEADQLHGSDLVLLLLAAPTSVSSAIRQINGITRLEKLLYLADRETSASKVVSEDPLRFVTYDYGPFSKDVYEAVEILEESGLVTEERFVNGQTVDDVEDARITGTVDDQEYVERRFTLTDQGDLVAGLLASKHPNVVVELSQIKDEYASRPLSSLIRYVYGAYPGDAVKSKIAHRFK